MTNDEATAQNPVDPVEELEEGSQGSLPDPQTPSGDDPLDKIEDPDTLRGEAKKYRSIAKRHEKKAPAPAETQVPAQPTDTLTQRDLHRINTKKAKQLAQQSDKPEDKEITANWDDIVPFASISVRGQDTEQDILEAMRDGHAAWKRNQPPPKPDNAGAELQRDTQAQRPSSPSAPSQERKTTPLMRKREGMDTWYKPKGD